MTTGKLSFTKNEFLVKYSKKNKPKGVRSYIVYANTFEDVLFEFCLNDLTNKVYGIDYWYEMLGIDVIIKREKAINPICIYSVKFKDNDRKKYKEEYLVEIECTYNSKEVEIMDGYSGDADPSFRGY